jgi:hypothetical protein
VSRSVRLVVCSRRGEPLGVLPTFDVASPWWPDVGSVVEAAKERFGVDLVVLRLLTAEGEGPGGEVTYLAELDAPIEVPLAALDEARLSIDVRSDHPLRAPWARPAGVAAMVAWADEELEAIGRPRTGPAVQIKSWNLSSILLLPTAQGTVYCKSVPRFLGHEGAILALIGTDQPHLVPRLLSRSAETCTVLLEEVAGDDQWSAPEARLVTMVRTIVKLQARWASRVERLESAGLPDWRLASFPGRIESLIDRAPVRSTLTGGELARLAVLAADLPRLVASLAACGVPETLVHGDFHPGNWRFDGRTLVLLDWGDSGVGHPMLDVPAFMGRVAPASRDRVHSAWLDAWRDECPLADLARASDLVAPVALLRQALVYQRFLDHIEPSERRYHERDVPDRLRRALAAYEELAQS